MFALALVCSSVMIYNTKDAYAFNDMRDIHECAVMGALETKNNKRSASFQVREFCIWCIF